MTDRELLELAAKAAGFSGIDFLAQDHWANVYDAEGRQSAWNPLTDDGDALRLAVNLGIVIRPFPSHHQGSQVVASMHPYIEEREYVSDNGQDMAAATRRAVTRAAAEIGKRM
jgi:hypothetical protein